MSKHRIEAMPTRAVMNREALVIQALRATSHAHVAARVGAGQRSPSLEDVSRPRELAAPQG